MNKRGGRTNRYKRRQSRIIALALFHRWGYIIGVFLLAPLGRALHISPLLLIGIEFMIFAGHSFIGYKLRWVHIYCSYQSTYRQKMTPYRVDWSMVKKSDAYGIPILLALMGIAAITASFLW